MQRILLQRTGDEHSRMIRVLLRDVIRNSRLDFDLLQYTNELISDQIIKENFSISPPATTSSGGDLLCDFAGQIQIRERYVNSICDLITMCVLVAITPQIKEAYQKAGRSAAVAAVTGVVEDASRDILIRYYTLTSQIQSDTVTWLQTIVSRKYEINVTELIKCLFKVRDGTLT